MVLGTNKVDIEARMERKSISSAYKHRKGRNDLKRKRGNRFESFVGKWLYLTVK